jgi:hypothetical protein
MSKLNGTSVLLYADGTLIACQTACTINFNQDLPDATCKDSGWAEHINGLRDATIDMEALYGTTGLSAEDLITYITGRTSLLLTCDVNSVPIVAEVNPSNVTLTADMESAVSVSGSFVATGGCYMLTPGNEDWTNGSYDTFTTSGLEVSSAINLAGTASAGTDSFAVVTGDVFKVFTFLTLNSGEAPSVFLYSAGNISNVVQLSEGVNSITLTATGTGTGTLHLTNTAAANFAITKTYVKKV